VHEEPSSPHICVRIATPTDVISDEHVCQVYESLLEISTSLLMSNSERTALRVLIDLEWAEARNDYVTAGRPFGDGRGLDIWIEFDQQTTVN